MEPHQLAPALGKDDICGCGSRKKGHNLIVLIS
jgi:hypothetical protein